MSEMKITIEITVDSNKQRAWEIWTTPKHIVQWNFATEGWHCPEAINELRVGGQFSYRMESKDGSQGFDFNGKYLEVQEPTLIHYALEDGREVLIQFVESERQVLISQTFEAEDQNAAEIQRAGWLQIMKNFKEYLERSS